MVWGGGRLEDSCSTHWVGRCLTVYDPPGWPVSGYDRLDILSRLEHHFNQVRFWRREGKE